ncbi:monovalent cation/H+ antiporter subunit A [Denitratisoma sp. DHT3]|uniref:monovalent cation/H+ antiporter subunit A n=1 Tax=Denitratisoma sp. DHT3 TaxID=1981880 RepID=UPI0011987754|nr:monovalent cation/H+ antiporter subunit A [Denitratisoma sp. DHT3]QDX83031.1 monovalent cation/H+ antiporter subunit A [Denitratisoma sp. DHT3]
MELILLTILPFLGSLCAAFLPSNARNAEAWLAGTVALAATAIIISLYPQVAAEGAGGVLRQHLPWAPALGLDISLRMDGFAWLFALLVTGMGTLVVIYARYYMSPTDSVPRFFSFFLAFMGAMLGVVLSGHLIQMVMFWEMTSLSSFMLIAYWHHRSEARRGARMALVVTGAGGLALFGGVLLLGHIAGSYDLDTVLTAGPRIQAHPWYPTVLVLIALGALTKSAQFPFHFWLPHAMSAPTPVSAYLHSATMVKAGVFLLARLWPVLAGTETWFWIVGGAGLCSLVLAGYLAMFQQDMKGVLAYSTISHLGLITLLLGMNSELALVAAVFHIVNHATFKASLFMAAGIVDHETGTRDLGRLSGLSRAMPLTAALAVVAAAAMAGVPLLNGFLSKEMFFAETVFLDRPDWQHVGLPLAATLAGVFSVAYSLRLIQRVFFGPLARNLPHAPHEPPRWMLLPSALLVAACVLVGIVPELVIGPFLRMATAAILGADAPTYSLAVWHGFNAPLLMSLVALGGGTLLHGALLTRRRATTVPLLEAIDGRNLFDAALRALTAGAGGGLRWLSSQRLQMQMLLIFIVALGGALLLVKPFGIGWGTRSPQPLEPAFALLWVVGGTCALAVAWLAKFHRFATIAFAGGAGLATSLTFVWFSAPDLALTQLTVEVVTTVLILLGLRWLPRRDKNIAGPGGASPRLRRARDILLAGACGLGLAALAYAVLTRPATDGIAPFFVQHALPQGGGLNVVNVILVDFRGFDTFGEITVLGIVALTVYALLRRFRPAPESIPLPRQQHEQDVQSGNAAPRNNQDALLPTGVMMLPAVLVRLLLPLAMLVSLFFLLRGHNAPGGGFVGGLILATAVILQYLVGGTLWVESRLPIQPLYWIAIGLLLAAAAGIGAAFAGAPFLTSQAWHGTLPVVGELHLSSVLLFDLGVYMLVVGATVLMLVAIAHQSLRSHHHRTATGETR